MPATKVTMVNPGQIVSKRWKGMTTARKVTEYAKKWRVPTVSWYDPASRKRTVLVEWYNFRKAWSAWKKDQTKKATKRSKKTTSRGKTKLSVVWSSAKKSKRTVKARRKKVYRRKVRRAA